MNFINKPFENLDEIVIEFDSFHSSQGRKYGYRRIIL